MLKAKKSVMNDRKENLKHQMNNDCVRGFFVHLPNEVYWKIKRYTTYNKMTLSEWLKDRISEIKDDIK